MTMQITRTEIYKDQDNKGGFTVEFHGDGGDRISVHMAATQNSDLSHENAVNKAQVILLQAARFGRSDENEADRPDDPSAAPSAAVESLLQEKQDKQTMQRGGSALEEGLEDTYPASDPVSATYTSTATIDQN
jgi:hypothetical protein